MKQMDVDYKVGGVEETLPMTLPPPPPPLPPLPRSWAAIKPVQSVTNQEIAKYWRQKRMEEEDHLLSAIKAAACIRARKLTEEEYRRFEESLEDDIDNAKKKDEDNNTTIATTNTEKELRVGIKDWWTKSKYAYLNQPAIDSTEKPKRSTYIPNFCFYKSPSLYPASLGIF
ncbi:homeobox and leucine zipper protein Homez-like [Macadamia integrifolia]|uniref:homeobox and leucine zipper protein Homez-like n=1 Tax=Macadamia integrifolia TaxID=60698 RepID=UPI001C4FC428|nr:homeobox and leucine zipper protein Homez-like [Macadamia integrifolia]